MEDKYSPVVLANSNVVEGIGQMIVLAVGNKTFKERNQLTSPTELVKLSILQKKIDEFFKWIESLALIVSIGICILKLLRVLIEIYFISDSVTFVSDSWKQKMKVLYYHNGDSLSIKIVIEEVVQGLILMLVIFVICIPQGLRKTIKISKALSATKLLEDGIYVKNINALESIGSLDRVIFDFTRGFTLNEISFDSCILNDHL